MPPCRGCSSRPPDLWPENRKAWSVYVRFGTQLRAGGMSILGFDYKGIWDTCDRLEIEIDADTFERLQWIEGFMLEQQAERARREEEKARQRQNR